MKPFPSIEAQIGGSPPMKKVTPQLDLSPGSSSSSNRRINQCPVTKIYPWLLFASTALAATFCLAYISKPVIHAAPSPLPVRLVDESPGLAPTVKQDPQPSGILPSGENLPGEPVILPVSPGSALASPSESQFEETNIRIQHVLTAESPDGEVNRIILDVPVLYQSRQLRWSDEEAAMARDILQRLNDYQDKTRALRLEGAELLDAWNQLVEASIPVESLRADSQSLPANQQSELYPRNTGSHETIEAIQFQKPSN